MTGGLLVQQAKSLELATLSVLVQSRTNWKKKINSRSKFHKRREVTGQTTASKLRPTGECGERMNTNLHRKQWQGNLAVTDELLEAQCGPLGELKTPGNPIMRRVHFYEFCLQGLYHILTVNVREKAPYTSGREGKRDILKYARTLCSS